MSILKAPVRWLPSHMLVIDPAKGYKSAPLLKQLWTCKEAHLYVRLGRTRMIAFEFIRGGRTRFQVLREGEANVVMYWGKWGMEYVGYDSRPSLDEFFDNALPTKHDLHDACDVIRRAVALKEHADFDIAEFFHSIRAMKTCASDNLKPSPFSLI